MGATCDVLLTSASSTNFNPRTREGCDTATISTISFSKNFNPRTREGCDPSLLDWRYKHIGFQSTHPRGVRLGAEQNIYTEEIIFQSTHPRGVRRRPSALQKLQRNFNPRTREGCDFNVYNPYNVEGGISIHAPARGATLKAKTRLLN